MILLNMKNSKTFSSPLNLTASKDKPLLSFGDLLKGVGEKKDITTQNGSLVLALGSDEKGVKSTKNSSNTQNLTTLSKNENLKSSSKESLSSLLKRDQLSQDEKSEILEFDPKLVENLTVSEMKTLISNAKNYLKETIQNSDEYKKAEIKELPKTLGGLIEAAKKFGIDINKITIQEVKTSKIEQNLSSSLSEIQPKDTQKGEIQSKEMATQKSEIQPKEMATQKSEIQPKEMTTQKGEIQPKELQDKKNGVTNDKQISLQSVDTQRSIDLKNIDKSVEAQNETPLFKSQALSEHTSTEQIVQIKPNNLSKSEQKISKEKSDDALKSLLSEERASKSTTSTNTDLAELKTSTLATTAESPKTLEHLLTTERPLSDQDLQGSKTEALSTHKADSVEVKINEAKQMIRYLSDDVKNAIDEYKSPFTRIKVQLNPQHLGEVDLTIVQRGKNLHVSLSSNNAAINALSMNANELRVQLNNSGINNATLNFSDTSQQNSYADNNSSTSEQHKRQNEQKAHSEYSYFENEEAHEEILSSLEIIVPRYI